MKKVLYISNIEVPYRTEFFNQFSKKCDLTVLYERKKSSNRNEEWTKSKERRYNIRYLNGLKVKNENSFSLRIIKYIFSKHDAIIIGCYNSPVQMLAILLMKIFRKKYILNLDGEVFIEGKSLKTSVKKFFIRGAYKYLVAGEKSAESLGKIVKKEKIVPYYLSSLTEKELERNKEKGNNAKRNDTILVVGQYFDYKGLDIALKAASMNQNLKYKFVGMGNRTELFKQELDKMNLKNVELVPFLQKEDLEKEYITCKMLVLPSRQECWGLVVNEAASYGTPIISTYGSGAAVEFLGKRYEKFLAKTNDPKDLLKKTEELNSIENLKEYSEYLIDKSKKYSIENNVKAHCDLLETRKE